MKITNITVSNFQSYDNATIPFSDGVSVIYGENGSGKSTVLRAIFAGLFQSDMRSESATEFDGLGDLITVGESTASVRIEFEKNGDTYTVDWTLSRTDPDDDSKGKTDSCTLTSTAYAEPYSGVRTVKNILQNDILEMSAQAFVNSVYVQQSELSQLISASPETRQTIFDDLLGLSQIDAYITRGVQARREIKSLLKQHNSKLEENRDQYATSPYTPAQLQTRINQLEHEQSQRKNIITQLNATASELQTDITQLQHQQETITDLQQQLSKAQQTHSRLQSQQDTKQATLTELTSEKQTLTNKLQHVTTQLESQPITDHSTCTQVLSELNTDINTLETTLSTISETISSLEQDKVRYQTQLTETETQLQDQTQRKTTLQDQLQSRTTKKHTLEHRKHSLSEFRTNRIQKLQSVIPHSTISPTDSTDDIRETIQSLYSTYTTKKTNLETKEATLETTISELTEQLADTQLPTGTAIISDTVRSTLDTSVLNETEIQHPLSTTDLKTHITQLLDEYTTISYDHTDTITLDNPRKSQDEILTTHMPNHSTTPNAILALIAVYELLGYNDRQHDIITTKTDLQNATTNLNTVTEQLHTVTTTLENIKTAQTILKTITELDSDIHALTYKHDEITDDIATLTHELDTLSDTLTKKQEHQRALSEKLNATTEKLTSKTNTQQTLNTRLTRLHEYQSDIETTNTLFTEQADIQEQLTTLDSQYTQVTDELQHITNELETTKNELETIKNTLEDTSKETLAYRITYLTDYKDTIKQEIQTQKHTHDELLQTISEFSTKYTRLQQLQDRITKQENTITTLNTHRDAIEDVIDTYKETKTTLRTQYIATITKYANDVFTTVYQSQTIQQIHLSPEYDIHLETTTGTHVSPDVVSGGEKALLNLALRAGIYRTIAEAHTKTTTSTTLPPLILDEPTTFLDTHHVSQLKTFISQVTNWNMNQVIIVSHDETLVDAADTSYHVQQHTNSRSTVTKT